MTIEIVRVLYYRGNAIASKVEYIGTIGTIVRCAKRRVVYREQGAVPQGYIAGDEGLGRRKMFPLQKEERKNRWIIKKKSYRL